MFPLRKRILIRGAKEHVADGLGVAADYQTQGIWIGDLLSWSKKKLYAPFSGRCWAWNEKNGGKWVSLKRKNGDVIEMAHLDRRFVNSTERHVKKGTTIAYTGNSGALTTGSHLHLQIKNKAGKRLDPEKYDFS